MLDRLLWGDDLDAPQKKAANNKDWIWGQYPERKLHIEELARRIKPVARKADGRPFVCAVRNPLRQAYLWDPQYKKEILHLRPLCDIQTYHSWGYYGFFKPSVAEIIAQIPDDILDVVAGFEIISWPQTSEDLNSQWGCVVEGYHKATTRLYSKVILVTFGDKLRRFFNTYLHDTRQG
jgi:hypothetical protein